jgi:hypothetical protein
MGAMKQKSAASATAFNNLFIPLPPYIKFLERTVVKVMPYEYNKNGGFVNPPFAFFLDFIGSPRAPLL